MSRLPATGAILAGGESRRMGRDKATLVVDGRTLVTRVHEAMAPLVDEVLLVVRPDQRSWAETVAPGAMRVVTDRIDARGPLAGIHAALSDAAHDRVLVVGCDMPDLQTPLLAALLSDTDAEVVIPRTARGYEPLHAVYARTCLPAIARALASGPVPVTAIFSDVRIHEWDEARLRAVDPTLRSLVNVNAPADLEGRT